MRHGRKKEREKRRRTDATIVKTKGMEKEWNLWKNKGSNRPQRVPFEKKVHQCSHQWTGAPTDGQGGPVKKKGGNPMEGAGQSYDASKS
jgi:hypothetical protein